MSTNGWKGDQNWEEELNFCIILICINIQNINCYRTVWWGSDTAFLWYPLTLICKYEHSRVGGGGQECNFYFLHLTVSMFIMGVTHDKHIRIKDVNSISIDLLMILLVGREGVGDSRKFFIFNLTGSLSIVEVTKGKQIRLDSRVRLRNS